MASLITDIGNAKLLVASPLNPVKIKSVVVGTGSAPFDSSIMSLQQQVWIGNASDPQKTLNNGLKFTTIIPSNVGSWTIQEWGLIDIEGDLIAYGQLDEGIYKQLGVMSIEPNFYIKLSSESETELVVTDSINFDHNALTNRSAVDSHPISSITGLAGSLQVLTENDASIQSEIDLNKQVKTISANYALTASDAGTFYIDASSSNVTVTMAKASTAKALKYIFIRTDNSTNTVQINPVAGDKLIGEGFEWPLCTLRQNEPFIFSKVDSSAWSGIRGSRAQITEVQGTPHFSISGVDKGQLALTSNFIVKTGTIENGGTIPLPEGFTENQCKWMVSVSDTTLCNLGANNQGADQFQLKCFTTGRVVTATISFYNTISGGTYDKGFTANYMLIGIK